MSTEENNFDEIAKNELEKREKDGGLFEQEAANRAKTEGVEEGELKPTSLGKSSDWQKKERG
jgi:hypothetical protein